jgi:iron complex transport system substrate-binding protein
MNHRNLAIIVSITMMVAVAALSGCTGSSPSPTVAPAGNYPMNVTDNFGRNITIPSLPQHIVSLSPANTEILFDLGLGDRIVGGTDFDDYPAAAKNITHVSGFNTVSYEKIANVSPDLIIAEDTTSEDAVNKLESMGYPVIVLKNSNMTMIENNIKLIGKATDTDANATVIVNGIDARMNNISAKTATLDDSQKPSVLLLAGYMPGENIYVYGNGTYGDDLIMLVGGKNAAAALTDFKVMTPEVMASADPDYIIVPVDNIMTTTEDFNSFKNGSLSWMKDMKAFKNGHILMVDGNLMERPGPRLPDAGLAMAKAIHPELFQ